MKRLSYLLSAGVLSAVLGITGCGSDDTPDVSPEDQVKQRLSKKWKLSSAKLGADIVTDLQKLEVTFTKDGKYTTNGDHLDVTRKPNPWPESGTWTLKDKITDAKDSEFTITRGDELDINVELADGELTLTFTFEETEHKGNKGTVVTPVSTGREGAVEGRWVMTFGL